MELIAFGLLALLFIAMLIMGARNPRSVAELTSQDEQKRWVTQATIEAGDTRQMLEAQNTLRRRAGKAELTTEELNERSRARQAENLARGKAADSRRG